MLHSRPTDPRTGGTRHLRGLGITVSPVQGSAPELFFFFWRPRLCQFQPLLLQTIRDKIIRDEEAQPQQALLLTVVHLKYSKTSSSVLKVTTKLFFPSFIFLSFLLIPQYPSSPESSTRNVSQLVACCLRPLGPPTLKKIKIFEKSRTLAWLK